MGTRSERVDAYIAQAADFARPILLELRDRIHAACPGVVETIKWRMPAFEYRGPLAGMAAFKAHCAFGFWKHDLILGREGKAKEAMGSFGRLTRLADLPAKGTFRKYVRLAMQLNEQGVKAPRTKTRPNQAAAVHPEFAKALARSRKAKAVFDAFAPSHRREYVAWIAEAKRDETRQRRIAQAIEWLLAGKPRNWKYMNC